MKKVPFNLKLHHVGFYVKDMDASIKWWEKMLGFTLAHRNYYALPRSKPTQMCWIKNKNMYIELYQFENGLQPFSMEHYSGEYGCKHVCFYVDHAEYQSIKTHLKEQGADFMVDIRWPNDQAVNPVKPLPADADSKTSHGVIYIRDLEGALIEIQEEHYPGEGPLPSGK
jgi:catechol 2,3-dioxygenase-like lactoylglutathione lyase family enzyme